jgi:predicted ATPase
LSLPSGTKLGHYEIVSFLGAGGMGEVYVATDVRLGRRVALKLLPARADEDPELVRRFTQEAQAASALNHPNIITIHDIGMSSAGRFIAMELVNGRTLREIGSPCPRDLLLHVGRQAAEALSVAHAAGIVHRDVKPENVMVRDDGYVKVLDFGLASLVPAVQVDPEADTRARTAPGLIVGTLRYMSPEQAQQHPLTSATDVFSLGLVLYELAAGRPAFEADSPVGFFHAMMSGLPAPASTFRPDLPIALDLLFQRMLERDSRMRPTAGEVEAALGDLVEVAARNAPRRVVRQRIGGHIVGRAEEQAGLHGALTAATEGPGRVVCVSGEAGAGKTTVVEAFLEDLEGGERRCCVARGRCSERLAGTEAYLPWLEALDDLLHGAGGETVVRLAQAVAPTWYRQLLPGPSLDDAPDPRAPSQERLKRELASLVREVSRERALVLFFDDLHWADASTIDLLAYLGDRLDGLPLLIIATYRPADLLLANHPFVHLRHALAARGVCSELALDLLEPVHVEEYLASRFPGHRFPSDLPTRIHARTEGSPLFMVDLVGYLCDRQVIAADQDGWFLTRPPAEFDHDLPASVRAMIDRKIAQLDEADRSLLAAGSVQGNEFDGSVVAEALALDPADVEERLDVLDRVYAFVRAIGQRQFPDHTVSTRFRFVHVLYQNALFDSVRPLRKIRWARALAHALEGHWQDQRATAANELAVLYETAREPAKAADCFRLAAQGASALFASQEAVMLARRALSMIDLIPASRDRAVLELASQVVLGNALMAIRGYAAEEVEQTYSRAEALCRELGETPHSLPVLFGVYGYQVVRAHLRAALAVGEEFLRRAERQGGPTLLIGQRLVGGASLYLGNLVDARRHLGDGTVLYDREQHRPLTWLYGQEPGTVLYSLLAITDWLLGCTDRALASGDEALRLGREVSHAHTHVQLYTFAAMHHQLRRDWARVAAFVRSLGELAVEQDMAFWANAARHLHGFVLAVEGEPRKGIAEIRRALDANRSMGAELFRPYSLCFIADTLGRMGEADEALAAADEARSAIEKSDERWWEAEVFRVRGEVLAWRAGGQSDRGEESIHAALAVARAQEARSLELRAAMSLGRLLSRTSRRAEAAARLADTLSWFTEGFDTADLQDARALLAELSDTSGR